MTVPLPPVVIMQLWPKTCVLRLGTKAVDWIPAKGLFGTGKSLKNPKGATGFSHLSNSDFLEIPGAGTITK